MIKKYSRKHIGFKTITNEGYEIEVIDGSDRKDYCTVLLDGYAIEASICSVKRGGVRNRNHKSVYGIGYLGYGHFNASDGLGHTRAYKTWKNMIRRCYDKNNTKLRPTYIDCTVCEEWHNFQVFGEWFEGNYIEGYELDKDILIKGNRVYSPLACKFVSRAENTVAAHAGFFRFLDPNGKLVEVYNLKEFCRKNGLLSPHMSMVHSGKRVHHKQWKKYQIKQLSKD